MKKLLLALIMLATLSANAQIYPDGTLIQSFSATDINNNFFSSTITNNDGKHFIIDFSTTWCGICWGYHNSKVLNRYYDKFGPSGTDAQDAEVLFYEGDAATNNNDLNGTGTNTVGDWVTGTNYKIFNESSISGVQSSFSANGALGYPTVFVVCADKKMYRLATNITDENLVRDFVNLNCGMTPLSANTIHALNFSYDVFPNPAVENVMLTVNLDKGTELKYTLLNTFGQVIRKFDAQQLVAGSHDLELNLSEVPNGFYVLQLQVGAEQVAEKIMIQR